MSVDTTTAAEATPAPGDEEAPALRERPRNRRRGFSVPRGVYVAAAGVVAVAALAAATIGLGVTEYQSQLGTVKVLEARAQAFTAPAAAVPPVEEKTKTLLADPVFSSPEWEAQLVASREVRRSVYEADRALAGQAVRDVWWPGLPERAKSAAALLEPFDAASGDAVEVATATAAAMKVCEVSDPDGFIANREQRTPAAETVSAYEAAVSAAFPGLVKAVRAHICPPGSQVSRPLPVDKEQMPKS
jgi:hypothetical protein